MSWITGIIVGFIIGGLARLVVPGKQPMPWWLTLGIGVVGATAGTALAFAAGWTDKDGFNIVELAVQVGIAAVLVIVVSRLRGSKNNDPAA